jgi:hypothetical protein
VYKPPRAAGIGFDARGVICNQSALSPPAFTGADKQITAARTTVVQMSLFSKPFMG